MDMILANGQGTGSVANKLLAANMNPAALRPWLEDDGRAFINVNGASVPTANATLRKDEWIQYDTALIAAAQDRLVGVADLISRGLTFNLPQGLGKTVLEYEDVDDINDAQLSMDGLNRSDNDRLNFELKGLPLPIVHKDFFLNARALAVSRNTGQPLDTAQAAAAGRKVSEKIEDMLFNGASSYAFGGYNLYGYRDFPNRNTGTVTTDWSSATGAQIVADVVAMKQALLDDKFYGPFMIYIPADAEANLDNDYVANYPKTIRQRILEINNIAGVMVADKMPTGEVLMVQMTSDVVRLVNGLNLQTVQWEEQGGMIFYFKAMAIQVPQIRARQDGTCGIAHYVVA